MRTQDGRPITFVEADAALQERVAREWGEVAARHMHLVNGFSLMAVCEGEPVGLISIAWRSLPAPLPPTVEGFVDIIEVSDGCRRQGIGRALIEQATDRCRAHGAYQVRAWSSDDRPEAISMWRALGFGLCPATVYPRGQEVRGYYVARVI